MGNQLLTWICFVLQNSEETDEEEDDIEDDDDDDDLDDDDDDDVDEESMEDGVMEDPMVSWISGFFLHFFSSLKLFTFPSVEVNTVSV